MLDGALTVGGISIATIIITKLKFYVKKNGSLNWGVGCSDKPLIDDDEVEIKQLDMGESVHVLYVMNKKHHKPEHEEHEYESADEQAHVEESCCFKTQ